MKRIVTLGEIMLRLKSPGFERLLQSPRLEATFGGGEANVAISLAHFGLPTAFVSALPGNALGEAALAELRRHGVDTRHIVRAGERLGLYYFEAGANQRPAAVIYDRAGSAFAETPAESYDWAGIFADAAWLHLTGITPALGDGPAAVALMACREARARGLTVSCDLSFRSALWTGHRPAPPVMNELFRLVDIGIGGREDCQRSLNIGSLDQVDSDSVEQQYGDLTAMVMRQFPNLRALALTIRESRSADRNDWRACLRNADEFILSPRYEITDIVDRVGTGDSFAAGLIYGLLHHDSAPQALAFATAAGCLKHSISGDFNRVSVAEVERLVQGETSGRVRR